MRAATLLAVVVAAGGCGTTPGPAAGGSGGQVFRGPIVVVTLSALSAGAAADGSTATPRLDAFMSEASWAGRAIASAPWCTASLASVFTGLPPAVHGAGHPAHPWLRPPTRVLAEELAAVGFTTRGFYGTPWLGPAFGLGRGFDALRPLRRRAAERYLAALDGSPTFTWIQLPLPGPQREENDLESAGRYRREAEALADRRLGRLLDALRRSGRWEESIVIVLADHGGGILESGAAPVGEEIGRSAVEVPFALRLPAAQAWRLQAPFGAPIGLDRVFATVIELVGGRPAPAAAPSLLRPSAWPAISELWFANGYHEVGLFEDQHQLRWRCRFAAPEPTFEEARREALAPGGSFRFGALIEALEEDFRRRPHCDLGEETLVEAWTETGDVVPIDDAELAAPMLERLRQLRRFPPWWSTAPPPPLPALRRRDLLALAGWGLPVRAQWAAPPR